MSLILFNTPKLFNLKKLKCIYYDSFYYNDFFPIALLLNKDQYSEGVFVSFNHKIVRKPSPWCEIPSLFSLLNWSKFEVIKDINTAYNRHEVMDSYNKNNFENISKSKINFPVNGPYIVANIFNNDTVNISCRGQFKNGQPDGKWLFYFCNGEISEERYYNEGIPVGVWGYKSSMSYIENVESNKYTSILRFKDGKLISIE
jgi:antitoxin component YwqK of YwqJK toxin-antitoxin module